MTGRQARKFYSLILVKARVILGLLLFFTLTFQGESTSASSSASRLDPELAARLVELSPDDMLRVIVLLRDQVNLRQHWGDTRQERLQNLNLALRTKADRSQQSIHELLDIKLSEGSGESPVYYWIFNGFSIMATRDLILDLAARPDVLNIRQEWQLSIPPDLQGIDSAQPNLEQINAPALWAMNVRGQGVVVATLDSGVSMSHDDLISRWRGGSNSWYDPYNEHPDYPTDLWGHGTNVMGILVAGEVNGSAVGVAPAAQWIAARIFDDRKNLTETATHQAFQWLLDPDGDPLSPDAPHVVNNSWGSSVPDCNLAYQADLQALLAAGILPVFSAGNLGPGESTGTSPGNYPEALAVGAVDGEDVIWPQSSRGPSDCDEPATIFPEIVAPGVGIYTLDRAGTYTTQTGTSMASPHAAGVLALLLSAYPNATTQEQRDALLQSALDLGEAGADNTYGFGRLDALAAFNWLAINYKTPTPTFTPTYTPTPTSTPTPAPKFFPEVFREFNPPPTPPNNYLPQIYRQSLPYP